MAKLIFSTAKRKAVSRAEKYNNKYLTTKKDGKTGSKEGSKKEVS